MSEEKKKYTFEDWLNGNFPEQPLIVLSKINDTITDETVSKIREAQREAWNKALEMTATAFKDSAKKELANVPKPELWLKREIQKIESFINDNPELEQKYASGKVDISDIQGSKYRRVNESYKDFKEGGCHFVGIDRKVNSKFQPSNLFRMYVDKEYLEFLKELRADFVKENESEKNQKGSNRETLDIAENWMDDLVREISSINVTQYRSTKKANNEVIKLFKEVYPDFIAKFDFTDLKTDFVSGGKLTKKSIHIALKFIFEKKHEPKTISVSAIDKRIKRKGLWN